MHTNSRRKVGWMLFALLASGLVTPTEGFAAGSNIRASFKEDVMPILHYRCLGCHRSGGSGVAYSGLNMETYEGLMQGTRFGPVVIPGNAMVSNLNVLVEGRAGIRMPHNRKRLNPCEIQTLRNWVNQGAKNN